MNRRGFLLGAAAAGAAVLTPFKITEQVLKAKPVPILVPEWNGPLVLEVQAIGENVEFFSGKLALPKGLEVFSPARMSLEFKSEIIDASNFFDSQNGHRTYITGKGSMELEFTQIVNSPDINLLDFVSHKKTLALYRRPHEVIVGDFFITNVSLGTL